MCKDLSVDNKNCSLDLINMNTVNTIVAPDSPQGDQLSVSIILISFGVFSFILPSESLMAMLNGT